MQIRPTLRKIKRGDIKGGGGPSKVRPAIKKPKHAGLWSDPTGRKPRRAFSK